MSEDYINFGKIKVYFSKISPFEKGIFNSFTIKEDCLDNFVIQFSEVSKFLLEEMRKEIDILLFWNVNHPEDFWGISYKNKVRWCSKDIIINLMGLEESFLDYIIEGIGNCITGQGIVRLHFNIYFLTFVGLGFGGKNETLSLLSYVNTKKIFERFLLEGEYNINTVFCSV